ncbi:hypothetical protein TrLO_g15790 [Triparma laevis f. longispina]|uniref:Uncharacterized protein n=1 Tax=Triparma laevis f. longispina TaxID=1714387 RepID=A0A9W7KTK7_9STRA|nr:hypothetical protein TrLO_g15790 [Triparma laevis f. longispina]
MLRRHALALLLALLLTFLSTTLSTSTATPDPPQNRPILILPIYQFGLANRLRQLASGIILAQELGRDLSVDWIRSSGCGATLSDLFIVSDLKQTFYEFESLEGRDEILHGLFSEEAPGNTKINEINSTMTFISHVGMFIETNSSHSTYLLKSPTVVLKINSAFFPRSISCTEFFERKSVIYKQLIEAMIPELKEVLLSVKASLPRGEKFVGVHVRATDEKHDWPVVAPQYGLLNSSGLVTQGGEESGENKSGTWEEFAGVDLFRNIMKEMKGGGRGGGEDVKFLLFSNSKKMKKQIVDWFPKNTVFALNYDDDKEGLMERDNVTGVREALLDFALLSETRIIVHSFGSSFGEEAATINMLPSVRVRLGGSIYGVDINLPGCNHPQIMNEEKVGQGEKVCFHDGSKDVCNNKLLKKYCAFVGNEWGFRDVYC